MVIVNQDKTGIYNFDNIKSIDVIENEINITDDILSNKGIVIGTYATEERAKEILQEIVKKYSSYLQLNGGPALIQGQMDVQPNIFNIPKIYEMPKE